MADRELLIEKSRLNMHYDARGILYDSQYFIYLIVNTKNNKIYVGSTTRGYRRRRAHYKLLRSNKHHSIHLQSAWNKYGEENFEFLIAEWLYFAEDIDKNIVNEYIESVEDFYIKSYSADYNMLKYARMSSGYSIRERMGEERYKVYMEKRIKTLMDNGHSERMIKYNKTRILSDETKRKMSAAQKGRKRSPEHIEAVRKAMIGGRRSEESKKRMSDKQKELRASGHIKTFKRKVIATDKVGNEILYNSLTEAAIELKTYTACITNATKHNQLHRGYHWKYVTAE